MLTVHVFSEEVKFLRIYLSGRQPVSEIFWKVLHQQHRFFGRERDTVYLAKAQFPRLLAEFVLPGFLSSWEARRVLLWSTRFVLKHRTAY